MFEEEASGLKLTKVTVSASQTPWMSLILTLQCGLNMAKNPAEIGGSSEQSALKFLSFC